jgi:Ca2+-transporting ATPase
MEKRGLSSQEAESRLKHHGLNEIRDVGKTSVFTILLRQVHNNFVVYLLVIAMILSFSVEKSITGYTLLAIILLVTCLGFIQEYRAETAVHALKSMIAPVSIVIRDGVEKEVLSKYLVPGDILILRTGEKVPADCIILEETGIRVNESILTGESAELAKSACSNLDSVEDKNKLFMGSYIVAGKALALVSQIGMKTAFGAIANLISKEEKTLPLQDKINHLTRNLVFVAIVFAVATGIAFLVRSPAIDSSVMIEMAFLVLALSVSAFPEGFPVVLVTTLSAGAYRMARQNAIVNRMSVIETLGETTVICSDKTGTITRGEMTVKYVYADGRTFKVEGTGYNGEGYFVVDGKRCVPEKDNVLYFLNKAAVICNDASISRTGDDSNYSLIGTPTEGSLLIMAAKAGVFREDMQSTRLAELPFTSERKLMSVLAKLDASYIFTKGAPEYVLSRCSSVERKDGIFTLTSSVKERILKDIRSLNAKGYRTLALAYKKTSKLTSHTDESQLVFLGFVALEDPPRDEVRLALAHCRNAGISVKMITGDNKETALSIGHQIGLVGPVLTGEDLDGLSDRALVSCVKDTVIFARVRPEHKLRIVSALKECGEIVTMTGDGVNDAPALKASHVGVAMGKGGTDVSRSVADITLKDDNFSTIVAAVREGRTIFNNMRKFVTYQISCNFAEIIILFLGVALGLPIPLVAIQILFMNMVTDDIPAITLGLNPSSNDIMEHKPRRETKLMNRNMAHMLVLAGSVMGLGTLGIFAYALYYLHLPLELARTTALVALIFLEVANAFNFRSFRKQVVTRSPFTNRALVLASFVSIAATILIVHTPLHTFFETVPLTKGLWGLALLPAIVVILVMDGAKYLNARFHFWKDLR